MSWILRIMANLLRPDEIGPAEAAYRALALIARLAPKGPTEPGRRRLRSSSRRQPGPPGPTMAL